MISANCWPKEVVLQLVVISKRQHFCLYRSSVDTAEHALHISFNSWLYDDLIRFQCVSLHALLRWCGGADLERLKCLSVRSFRFFFFRFSLVRALGYSWIEQLMAPSTVATPRAAASGRKQKAEAVAASSETPVENDAERKYHDVEKEVLECPICLEQFTPPVYQVCYLHIHPLF
jgi:hypothetical protein